MKPGAGSLVHVPFPMLDWKDATIVLASSGPPMCPITVNTYKLFIQEDILALERKDTPTSFRLALLPAA